MSIHYPFPTIRHINDVLPAIKDCPEFVVVQKDGGYTVINYVMAGQTTFPSVSKTLVYIETSDGVFMKPIHDQNAAIRRECRGLIFDTATGLLVSRRLHKFFNMGERGDTVPDLSKPHVVLEKLDGSMITPIPMPGGAYRWGTKMGVTDVSMQAEEFVASRHEYTNAAFQLLHKANSTPIFEWCSRQQQIVLDYPEDALVLTAIRYNVTGHYWRYDEMYKFAEAHDIPVVQAREGKITQGAIFDIRTAEDIEGVVIRFDDGHMIKIKCDWYVQLHRAKDSLMRERDVIRMILEDKTDDVIPVLPPADVERLERFADDVRGDIMTFAAEVWKAMHDLRSAAIDRKTFAGLNRHPPASRSCIFTLWDKPIDEVLREAQQWATQFVLRNTSNNASLRDKAQGVIKTARWKEEVPA